MRVFVAGAAGAIGRRLVPQLVDRGHQVTATTRSRGKVDLLRALGAEPVVVDGLAAAAVGEAVARAAPNAIVHQMTALAEGQDLRRFDRWFAVTNELRTRGTEHLLAAARAAGVERFVAQSYTGWTNSRTGGPVKTEDDPLDPHPAKAQRRSLAAIRFLERVVAEAPLAGVVLRYGNFYGPGASGRGPTATTRPRRPAPRSRAASRASTTSSTTSRRRWRNGCPTWPRSSAHGRRCGSRPGSAGSRREKSPSGG